jgi:hypothetical protein
MQWQRLVFLTGPVLYGYHLVREPTQAAMVKVIFVSQA